jgi:hypothetical protein
MEGYCIALQAKQYLFGIFSKHHELNYFSLDYQRGIAYGKEYLMHMHCPLVGYPKNTLGSKTYILKLVGVLQNHTKELITIIRVFNN